MEEVGWENMELTELARPRRSWLEEIYWRLVLQRERGLSDWVRTVRCASRCIINPLFVH